MSLAAWEANPTATAEVTEDHAWFAKTHKSHINLLESDAVIRSFTVLTGYAKKNDYVKLLIDSKVVVGWLNRLATDQKIRTSGLYSTLVSRRLGTVQELFEDYRIEVVWVETHLNPADKLTRWLTYRLIHLSSITNDIENLSVT